MPAEKLPIGKDLKQLLAGFADAPALQITGLSSDSRRLRRGDVFVACDGIDSNGMDYIDQAIAAGAIAVIHDATADVAAEVAIPAIAVPDLPKHLGSIVDRFFDSPSQAIRVAGVTGTNGKTTVACMIAQCLQLQASKCAYIGTLGTGIDDLDTSLGMTTPACIDLHRKLAEFRDAQATDVAMEVSSHALAQGRVDGVRFDSVIFTNLSRDHIDYHGDMHAYGEAKAKLFTDFPARHKIVNVDSPFGRALAERSGDGTVVVSTEPAMSGNGRPYVFVRSLSAQRDGSVVAVETSWGDAEFLLPLVGEFNVANAISVLAFLLCRMTPLAQATDLLEAVQAPAGRMQRVEKSDDHTLPAVYVDYAHTPSALEVALNALRPHCDGQLWCVFGCGGERDQGKRPLMGGAVARFADRAVVTNDNPRAEDPGTIIQQVLAGMDSGAVAIEDRAAAIAWAISNAAADDIVLIAGKGHETTQHIGDRLLPFSDFEWALANLEKRQETGAAQ